MRNNTLIARPFLLTAFCLLLTAYCSLFLPSCSGENSKQPAAFPPVPVTVADVIAESVPVQISAIGNVEAYSTVGIKSQIGGTLMHVHFKEGQDVNKGDILFTIDPRPYESALKQAEANLSRDKAQMENSRVEVRRYAELVKKGYVAQELYDQILTNATALEAIVKADEAAVENARLQLGYCSINAPVSGRTGSLLAHKGNLIKANADSDMVVINQIQPVYVNFSVPEHNLSNIRKHIALGNVEVQAITTNNKKPEVGRLTFIDNTVDAATGTIALKATFDNRERVLWPGQFVNVQMTLTTIRDAVVAPSQAVQTGQQGQFVFVVKEGSAELRPVKVGITHKDMTVIEDGLSLGETVVTDGQLRLMPGAKVEIKNKK
jgi:multidrug efflux system membrane fusion protein